MKRVVQTALLTLAVCGTALAGVAEKKAYKEIAPARSLRALRGGGANAVASAS